MFSESEPKRYELKFYIPEDLIPHVLEFSKNHTQLDPYTDKKKKEYCVRSLYLDTDDFNFYYEKLDGLKVRKKLRVRVYNEHQENVKGFLEIKRRFENCIFKERMSLPYSEIKKLIKNPEIQDITFEESRNGKLVLGRFIYNVVKFNLKPTIAVVYERKAYVGKVDPEVRLTLDMNVRIKPVDEIGEIYTESNLKHILGRNVILELKFNDFMPRWMSNLVKHLSIKPESISKYCSGIDAHLNEGIIQFD